MTSDLIPVICLPHAGAGASFYFSWRRSAPVCLELLSLQPPGREERTDEEPHRDIGTAVEALLPDLTEVMTGRPAFALFGHSLGAALAYELARAVEERTELSVRHVFVSGSPAPARGRGGNSASLDDAEFVARVEELAGYRHPAFDYPELREIILPTLRADVAMHEAYRPASPAPIQAAITCLRGADDCLVSAADAADWKSATAGECRFVELPGGHMYLTESAPALLDLLARTLRRHAHAGELRIGGAG